MISVLDAFEKTCGEYKDKIALGDIENQVEFEEFELNSIKIGSGLLGLGALRRPVAILLERSVNTAFAMIGILYSGNFYVVLDADSPVERLEKIISVLQPVALITENRLKAVAEVVFGGKIFDIDELSSGEADYAGLAAVRKQMVSSDPAYAIFTSGSTGFPKGALISHKNVIAYSEWFTKCFKFNENTVFGSQTPFYFSMSVSDFFSCVFCGAEYEIIPKVYFAFPARLIEFMNQRKINSIYWVPSAYGIVAKLDLFKFAMPLYLETALFAGEVMPVKYLNYWKKYLPHLLYANLFGPTETTDICSYYIVNREFTEEQTLPIGVPCENCRLFSVDESGNEIKEEGEIGELYAAGDFLAFGYYNNPEKTKEAFVQNPLNTGYPETVYKTGDLVKLNGYGEYEYAGRKDFQIKHMGYRIELGEIEAVMGAVSGVNTAVCLYNQNKDEIILIYEGGEKDKSGIRESALSKLPVYMVPDKFEAVSFLPYNANGKIDRKLLKDKYCV